MCGLTFGERLTDLRLTVGLSQRELASALGVSESTVRSYENGRFCPPMHILIRMGRYFSVTLDYLVANVDYNLSISALDDDFTTFNNKKITVGKLLEIQLILDDKSRAEVYEMIDALIRGGKLKTRKDKE